MFSSINFMSTLPASEPAPLNANAPAKSHQLDHIRFAMIQTLDRYEVRRKKAIERQILFAPTAKDLWLLRADIMQVLAEHIGERAAIVKLQELSTVFQPLLPHEWARFSNQRL